MYEVEGAYRAILSPQVSISWRTKVVCIKFLDIWL